MEAVSMLAIQPLMLDRAHTRRSHRLRSGGGGGGRRCPMLHLQAFEIGCSSSSALKLSKLGN